MIVAVRDVRFYGVSIIPKRLKMNYFLLAFLPATLRTALSAGSRERMQSG